MGFCLGTAFTEENMAHILVIGSSCLGLKCIHGTERNIFTSMKFVTIYVRSQGFIQALLLTSVFHEGLSFMAVGYNPTCVSTFAIAAGSSYGAL